MNRPSSHHEEGEEEEGEENDAQVFLDESDIIHEVPLDEEGPSSLSLSLALRVYVYICVYVHSYMYVWIGRSS